MSSLKSARLHEHFAELTDPRRREVTYPLINVVSIAVCAVNCGADDFVAIAKFGETKREWLAGFLDLKDGIPSHDRFNAILAAIKPAEFEKCLLSWITTLHEITDGQVIAIRLPWTASASSARPHWNERKCRGFGQSVNMRFMGRLLLFLRRSSIGAAPPGAARRPCLARYDCPFS